MAISKGSWTTGKTGGTVITDNGEGFERETGHDYAEYYGGHLIAESISKADDAKLIAAAPDMLKSLIEANRMYEEVQPAGGWQGVYEMIESAINKATK